jgi:hypothetical protein
VVLVKFAVLFIQMESGPCMLDVMGDILNVSTLVVTQGPFVAVSVTTYVPLLANKWEGEVSMEVLFPPLEGSPKFHEKEAPLELTVLFVKATVVCV